MKYKLFVLIMFFISIFIIENINAKKNYPLLGKIIVIDVGHGGVDPGTTADDIYEENINLNIAKYLEIELINNGAFVILTRDGDYDLSNPNTGTRKRDDFDNRIKLINNSNADIYLSLHLNYLTAKKYSGGQMFYSEVNKKNKEIAEIFQNQFNKVLDSNREIKNIPSDLYMYKQLEIPGILVECGFLSNLVERNKLNTVSYQKKLAQVLTLGLKDYFKIQSVPFFYF